jgi:hypothetical protein
VAGQGDQPSEGQPAVRDRVWVGALTVALLALLAIVLRHRWPKLITSEDIEIFSAALALIATGLAMVAARHSHESARESHRALALHFRPGPVRVGFSTVDPAQAPAPLSISVAFWDPVQRQYEVKWIDHQGKSHDQTLTTEGGHTEHSIRLEGIVAEERQDGYPQVVAAVPRLRFTCTDEHVRTVWHATMSEAPGTELGSYLLHFTPFY